MISRIQAAVAAFAAMPAVTLPVGLQENIMAKDFDFDWCLAKFDLSWKKAAKVLQKQSFKNRANPDREARLKAKEQKQEQKRVAKLKEEKQKNREARRRKRKKQKLLVLGFNPK